MARPKLLQLDRHPRRDRRVRRHQRRRGARRFQRLAERESRWRAHSSCSLRAATSTSPSVAAGGTGAAAALTSVVSAGHLASDTSRARSASAGGTAPSRLDLGAADAGALQPLAEPVLRMAGNRHAAADCREGRVVEFEIEAGQHDGAVRQPRGRRQQFRRGRDRAGRAGRNHRGRVALSPPAGVPRRGSAGEGPVAARGERIG